MEVTRDENWKLAAYAWPGGYPVFYLTTDGGVLCAGNECANGTESIACSENCLEDDGWRVIAGDIHWEGEPLTCDHCNGEIESAYGPVEGEA